MRSVPRAVATGSTVHTARDRKDDNPVATARGTDLIAVRKEVEKHMKLIALNCLAFAVVIVITGYGPPQTVRGKSVTWKINNLNEIGGKPVTVIGGPLLIDVPGGKAVLFDGTDDGLVVNANPIAGARAFTLEVVFRPDANGAKEQRWFHIQQDKSENRVLLETRLFGDQWFLDTYIRSGESNHALFAENFKHRIRGWYHIAIVF